MGHHGMIHRFIPTVCVCWGGGGWVSDPLYSMPGKKTSTHENGNKKPRGTPRGVTTIKEKNKYVQSRQGTTDVDTAQVGRKAGMDWSEQTLHISYETVTKQWASQRTYYCTDKTKLAPDE